MGVVEQNVYNTNSTACPENRGCIGVFTGAKRGIPSHKGVDPEDSGMVR